jgi:hypothetical protein
MCSKGNFPDGKVAGAEIQKSLPSGVEASHLELYSPMNRVYKDTSVTSGQNEWHQVTKIRRTLYVRSEVFSAVATNCPQYARLEIFTAVKIPFWNYDSL